MTPLAPTSTCEAQARGPHSVALSLVLVRILYDVLLSPERGCLLTTAGATGDL